MRIIAKNYVLFYIGLISSCRLVFTFHYCPIILILCLAPFFCTVAFRLSSCHYHVSSLLHVTFMFINAKKAKTKQDL